MHTPLDLLQQGVASLLPGFDPASGVLNDPLFGSPTQYSTPYFAWCSAVLAAQTGGAERTAHAARARLALNAALDYVLAPELPALPSGFARDTGKASTLNHRDFFWPPILKTWRLLGDLGELGAPGELGAGLNAGPHTGSDAALHAVPAAVSDGYAHKIARVDPLAAFAMRPPNNWAAVWLSGEWLRMRAGLSGTSPETFDAWLGEFFRAHILLEQGFYQEPGHSNAYDLFTRAHLADLLAAGYAGAWQAQLQALLRTGLRRSLAVQLSDGALASAHRSSGQSWTDGAQVAFFTYAGNALAGAEPALAAAARRAAALAFRSMRRWQRTGGPFSPVHNCLPPECRVGYEAYTGDGHYSTLALAFLATAIQAGFAESCPWQAEAASFARPPATWIEGDPIWRALLQHGALSLQVNAFPAGQYDAFGPTDLSFGPDRLLQLVSSVRFAESGQLFNPGLALRPAPGLSQPVPAARPGGGEPMLIEPLAQGDTPASLRLLARPRGAFFPYLLEARLEAGRARFHEATPGRSGPRSLLVPFLRDGGDGRLVRWQFAPGRLELTLGEEILSVEWDGPAERAFVLAEHFENRRGRCALARIDLAGAGEDLHWRIEKVQ